MSNNRDPSTGEQLYSELLPRRGPERDPVREVAMYTNESVPLVDITSHPAFLSAHNTDKFLKGSPAYTNDNPAGGLPVYLNDSQPAELPVYDNDEVSACTPKTNPQSPSNFDPFLPVSGALKTTASKTPNNNDLVLYENSEDRPATFEYDSNLDAVTSLVRIWTDHAHDAFVLSTEMLCIHFGNRTLMAVIIDVGDLNFVSRFGDNGHLLSVYLLQLRNP